MGALQFFVRSSKRHYRVSPSPAAEVNSSAKVGNNGDISRQLAPISSTLHLSTADPMQTVLIIQTHRATKS